MRLLNFELSNSVRPIEIKGLGRSWDLHNQAEFLSLSFDPLANTIIMGWVVGPDLPYSAVKLLFANVRTLHISPRDVEVPPSEDYCLEFVAKVTPGPAEYRLKREWGVDDPFHLLFEFRSERTILINSETVELIGVLKTI